VQRADKICYMEHGQVLESGTHEELVALRGRYARLVEKQFLGSDAQLAAAGLGEPPE
jgi:ABC-type multidrug transport system fused ATPase/permease subunit